ncbi:MAG: DUF2442 domain-containing protein [Caldilineaceae bacterium]|nr:DUF2442 domain-containing protein [Caldilineaceae bacterium]MBP8110587.1 DUF2442 domain-containing protein [Caldilineaceae bacterium]MBP9073627.1 DUF2442 domain-containing protein [Caldilineaceae bacterium]
MTIAIRPNPQKASEQDEPRFVTIAVSDEYITAELSDGRLVSVPLAWSWRLEQASPTQRNDYRFLGAAHTVYWPEVDEHLSVRGFLFGEPAPRRT